MAQAVGRPLAVAGKVAVVLAAFAVSAPLAFLFLLGIPGFMLPTTGSDPWEKFEYWFWIILAISIPVLLAAIWLSAIGIVVRRGRTYWSATALTWACFIGLFIIAQLVLRDFAGISSALFRPLPDAALADGW